MYTLVIGRAFPAKETGMMGIFEFEQAELLASKGNKTVYAFVDTRSVKRLKKFNKINFIKKDLSVIGYHIPIGGIPKFIFEKVKKLYFKALLKNIIEKYGVPDVIHVHFPLLNLTKDIWAHLKEFNVPIIVTEHWSKVQKKEIENHYVDLLRKIVKESSEFLAVGTSLRDSIIELTNTDREIPIIHNMVSNIFDYKRLNVQNKQYRFIAIGRIIPEKRFDELIKIFYKTFKDNNGVELVIIGDGPSKNMLTKIIKQYKLTEKITLKGFLSREDIVKELQRSDTYVSSSEIETFGVPYIEALSCGKPIIGKKNGVIENIVKNDKFGKIYDELSELEYAMKYVYQNKKIYDPLQISKEIKMQYGQENVYKQLNQIYTKIRKEYYSE